MNEEIFNKIVSDINELNCTVQLGHIVNRPSSGDNLIEYDKEILLKIPKFEQCGTVGIVGHVIQLTFSDSISGYCTTNEITSEFLEKIKKCESIVDLINKYLEKGLATARVLLLERKVDKIIILQCAISIQSENSVKQIVDMSHQFSTIFSKAGFVTIREKIYSNIDFVDEFAELTSEMVKRNRYYEYIVEIVGHIENISLLNNVMTECADYLKTYVSKSIPIYSLEPITYINYAFRNINKQLGIENLSYVCNKIKDKKFVLKTVESKYVWYDTYSIADNDWICPDGTHSATGMGMGMIKKETGYYFSRYFSTIAIATFTIGAIMVMRRK